ncbi:hypothetical protein CA608_12565 [Caulobacter vibrioides]|uniref:tyrosine-type recombinase/integrase n=1 Tax=Caulobacter vibrioides TaxID=155892 RepID=UPI000BB4DFE1|nr:tyrosine-type recombinase/integrase [Caulobacter vibrioides]ATC25306.1 hypothetical protein CA608_12565 [Caulobacter vibrioides]
MSRSAKGARLYLRKGRVDSKSGKRLPDIYFIRDGAIEIGTGCGPERLHEAEQALQAYIASKSRPERLGGSDRQNPTKIFVADVLALYAAEKAPELASDPRTTAGFIKHLLDWWGDRKLSDIKRSTCKQYVAHRITQRVSTAKTSQRKVSDQTARRELEVLSAAIGYWDGEDRLTNRPEVWLPDKAESPRDALTRSQAAALLRASMGWRLDKEGRWRRLSKSAIANRAHLRRFILLGLYTGTRHSVLTKLLWKQSRLQAWVDLGGGVIYRRGADEKEQKTKRRPLVVLPPRMIAHMSRWHKLDMKAERAVMTVLHHGGEPIRGKIRTGFASCVRDAGLSGEITPHWLRHTAATWLMENGANAWEAAGYLGMEVATLEKNYGHRRPSHQANAVKAITRGRAA